MSRTLLLDHEETRRAMDLDAALSKVREALIATSRGEDSTPPRIAARSHSGLLGAMPGFVPGMGLAAKLVSVFSATDEGGRSGHQGIVALFDDTTGELRAIMNGEAITAVRTAVCATVAFQALSPATARRFAIVGAGAQARAQLELLIHVGSEADIVVASRTTVRASDLAGDFGVTAAVSVQDAVSAADVIFCCTDAAQPVIERRWLRPGIHVSSVGGTRGPELDRATILESVVFAEWPGATGPPPSGAHELQGLDADHVKLIGAVLSGEQPGRVGDETTVFKSTGYAALDVAAAAVVFEGARLHGLGTWVDL